MDCDGCVFNIMDNNPPSSGGPWAGNQIGCKAGRIEKYIERGEATLSLGRKFYELKRFCNMYRDEDGVTPEKARKQVKQNFGVVIEDSLDANTWEELLELVDRVLQIDYDPAHIKIIISTNRKRGVNNVCTLVDKMRKTFRHSRAVFHEHDVQDLKEYEDFSQITNATYFVNLKTWKNPKFQNGFLQDIDERTNDQLIPIVIEKFDGFYVVLKQAVNSVYLDFYDYEKTVEAIYKIAQEGDSGKAE